MVKTRHLDMLQIHARKLVVSLTPSVEQWKGYLRRVSRRPCTGAPRRVIGYRSSMCRMHLPATIDAPART